MEAFHYKWKNLHQSAKSQTISPSSMQERFRSTSKDKDSLCSNQKHMSSISKLLPFKQKGSEKASVREYYEVRGKENQKVKNTYEDVNVLKKQLSTMCENRPKDKHIIDAALLLMSKYEQNIQVLQQQNQMLNKKLSQIPRKSLDQPEGHPQHDLFSSQKTVSSQSSNKKVPAVHSNCPTDYYFSMIPSNEQ